ncbi:MAG: hypothetical protein ACLU38_10025 [Dysosmobacter sp.]
MSSYDALAASYDGLMADGVYRRRADYLEKLFQKSRIPVHTVLDLGLRHRDHRLSAGGQGLCGHGYGPVGGNADSG